VIATGDSSTIVHPFWPKLVYAPAAAPNPGLTFRA
jgi:hypothetical protein